MQSQRKTPNIGFVRQDVEKMLPVWSAIRDVQDADRMQLAKTKYLPQPIFSLDPDENDAIYGKYLKRACLYPVTGRTKTGLVGEVFAKEPKIELPTILEPFKEDIDGSGVTLEQQIKGVLGSVLESGNEGLLVDSPPVPEGETIIQADLDAGKYRPRIIHYKSRQIINWHTKEVSGKTILNLLVLKEEATLETGDEFTQETKPQWRVYKLTTTQTENGEPADVVTVEVWQEDEELSKTSKIKEYVRVEEPRVVTMHGGTPWQVIPFQFIGADNNNPTLDPPPLKDLAYLNIHHFRNSADFEDAVFNSGQFTPYVTGLTQQWVDANFKNGILMGYRRLLPLPVGAQAGVMQPNLNTLAEKAMLIKEDQMKALGAKLIEPQTVERTAYEAGLDKISEVSVLSTVAGNVSAGYENALHWLALFLQETERQSVIYELSTQYDFGGMTAAELVDSWTKGLISSTEARDGLRRKGTKLLDDDTATEQIRAAGVDF